MNRRFVVLFLVCAGVWLPFRAPAPLIYTPGEGWTYEAVGSTGKWQRVTAKEQLLVAQEAFDQKNYRLALKAARRLVRRWPLADYAPQAQYLMGRSYEARHLDEKAFREYQALLEKYPQAVHYEEVLKRQYEIANRFLAGQWFRLWGYIPFFPSMERTTELFEKIVKSGPYSDLAPLAQMKIGEAREKQANYPAAVTAYERAVDRYHDQPKIAADALFQQGLAWRKQVQTAEYDQSTAGRAIAVFTDFMTLYPDDPRWSEAQKIIAELKTEQARGNYEIAAYYERNRKWRAAKTYYNEVANRLLDNPESPYAVQARTRIDALNKLLLAESK